MWTPKQAEQVEEYIKTFLLDFFGLGRIIVKVCDSPADFEDEERWTAARIRSADEEYRLLNVQLCARFFELMPKEQRHTIVHECCHYPLLRYEKLFDAKLKDSEDESEFVKVATVSAHEFAIETFALALADFAPLPKFDRPKPQKA